MVPIPASATGTSRHDSTLGPNVNAQSETKNVRPIASHALNSSDFQTAAVAAQQFHGQDWDAMSCRAQATAVYAELQKIDTGRVSAVLKARERRSFVAKNR
jgi:hypothetical protein